MTPHNPYRDGLVHIQGRKCSTCIFRPGNLMRLEAGRVDSMVAESIAEQTGIICHDTLGKANALCRGFVDVHGDKVMPIRLAYAMGVVSEVPTP